MKVPLLRVEFIEKWGKYRFTLICVLFLVMMMVFGYQLALFNHKETQKQQASEQQSLSFVQAENSRLRKKVSALEVASVLARKKADALIQAEEANQQQLRELEQQLAFYQRVVAPEKTQDGFLVDGVQVEPTASIRNYRLTAVLLQRNTHKALIKGGLSIVIEGSLNGQPRTLSGEQLAAESKVDWGFRFFQPIDYTFTLPEGFSPERIVLKTPVYQWKTLRGDYQRIVNWQDALIHPNSENDV
ncbi:DUF6776 family protein [Aestuariibacter sp. A3R04]|uniref:DUF6776 family protein n=1 Tax=Aestuariibacter sp. A3R04 TaxID=2841571 RepID=UPI001C09F43F|nr:DUF6776 family protein [Aestuariibacter sp. A3R04]MBU3021430.1 hypothetical protein [Aestuariibacter sp. A3R04]